MTQPNALFAGKPSPELYEYLIRRRSAKKLTEPGPDEAAIGKILKAASRVPDHGKLAPWRFLIFTGDARREAGDILRRAWAARDPEASPAKLDLEGERFLRAPAVIAVISAIREDRHPAWEQILSAGAACMTLCLAANALGFATNWLTEWYSYDESVKRDLGIAPEDNIAGFIYIGTALEPPEERERPDPALIAARWRFGGA